MFFHGGGYCSGWILSHRRMVTEAGRAARMRSVAIGYRLGPEHPYPVGDLSRSDGSRRPRQRRRARIDHDALGHAEPAAVSGDDDERPQQTAINRFNCAGKKPVGMSRTWSQHRGATDNAPRSA